MSEWKPKDYLKFAKERTQPSIDLASRLTLTDPKRILDVGCGPGNSTKVLMDLYKNAEITGLDASKNMIASARENFPQGNWVHQDATSDLSTLGKFDIIFSNAAIQWMDNNHLLIAKLYDMLNPGGTLAIQVPYTEKMPIHTAFLKLLYTPQWSYALDQGFKMYTKYPPDYYYKIISSLTDNYNMWITDYYHIMNSYCEIADWYASSGLRQFLEIIGPTKTEVFRQEYITLLKKKYKKQYNGKIIMPFTRIFFTLDK